VTIVVIVVYIIVCFATVVYFAKRRGYNALVHWVMPLVGAAAFVPPLYYQYFPLPPYPVRVANWVALGWLGAGLIVTALAPRRILNNVEELFVEEMPVGIAGPDVPPPVEPAGAPAS
jgi:amino acid transporter